MSGTDPATPLSMPGYPLLMHYNPPLPLPTVLCLGNIHSLEKLDMRILIFWLGRIKNANKVWFEKYVYN